MLKNLKLQTKLLLLTGAPVIGMLLFLIVLVSDANQERVNSNNIKEMVSLAVVNSELVHELQKERGLTAAFLGSGGAEEFKQKLISQRKLTDRFYQTKKDSIEQFDSLVETFGLTEMTRENQSMLNQLAGNRRQVDSLSIEPANAIGFYTQLNAALLNVVSSVSELSGNANIKQQGLAYYFFIQGKERAGIERAILSKTFGEDSMDIDTYKHFTSVVLLQDVYFSEFKNVATPSLVSVYESAARAPSFSDVQRFRDTVNQQNLNGNFGVSAAVWFERATQRINELKKVEDKIAQDIQTLTEDVASSQVNKLTFFALVGIGISSLCLWLGMTIILGVKKQVGSLVDTLDYSAKNNALDRALAEFGKDELSLIGRSVNKVFESFKTAIQTISSNSVELATASERNSDAVEQASKALSEQKEQTYSVASSVEEMAQSINEVSGNTTAAASKAEEAQSIAKASYVVIEQSARQINDVAHNVGRVHEMVTELNTSSTEITNVIDVIKSVAEQTNLLALNAAIEAARAGEQGRGFAVVADEVRALAQRTQESTEQIEQIINGFTTLINDAFLVIESCQEDARQTAKKSDETKDDFENIRNVIADISNMITQIATATEQQAHVATLVSQSISQISSAADESALAAKEIATTSYDQASLAKGLRALSSQFVT